MQARLSKALAERTQPRGHQDAWHYADIVCGGFPCQDISNAGRRAGIAGERSGLWGWLCGAICLVRPLYALVENVAALLHNGMDTVCGDLAEIGYDAEWNCISAADVGAPHLRERIWILAYPKCAERRPFSEPCGANRIELLPQGKESSVRLGGSNAHVAHAVSGEGTRLGQYGGQVLSEQETVRPGGRSSSLADSESQRCGEARPDCERPEERIASSRDVSDPDAERLSQLNGSGNGGSPFRGIITGSEFERILAEDRTEQWFVEPDVGRVADGIPNRAHRLRGLGNAVVPEIPYILGKAIRKYLP